MAGMKLVKKGALLDRRAETIAGIRTPPAEVMPPAPSGPAKFLPGENFEDSINRLLDEARDRYRLVGDRLLEWKDATPHGQFMRLVTERIEAGALRLPNYQAANRFMVIAEAIRDGRVPEDALPKEDGAAYLLASLRPDEISAAQKEGLVRPTVKKAELTAFRKRLRSPSPAPQTDERAQLLAERERLVKRLAEIDRRLSEV